MKATSVLNPHSVCDLHSAHVTSTSRRRNGCDSANAEMQAVQSSGASGGGELNGELVEMGMMRYSSNPVTRYSLLALSSSSPRSVVSPGRKMSAIPSVTTMPSPSPSLIATGRPPNPPPVASADTEAVVNIGLTESLQLDAGAVTGAGTAGGTSSTAEAASPGAATNSPRPSVAVSSPEANQPKATYNTNSNTNSSTSGGNPAEKVDKGRADAYKQFANEGVLRPSGPSRAFHNKLAEYAKSAGASAGVGAGKNTKESDVTNGAKTGGDEDGDGDSASVGGGQVSAADTAATVSSSPSVTTGAGSSTGSGYGNGSGSGNVIGDEEAGPHQAEHGGMFSDVHSEDEGGEGE